MSAHREIMQGARQLLHDNMGRLVRYVPPEGVSARPVDDVSVRWTAAEDVYVPVNGGEERKRSVIVSVQIGRGAGMLSGVQINGVFFLDVDGSGEPLAWTVHSLPHTDADGAGGFVRAQCVRDVLQSGIVGTDRPGLRGR